MLLASVVGAGNSHAATLIWTNGNDYWQSTTAWTTNLAGGTGGFPGSGDDAFFTNAATYSVTLTADVLNIQSNFFSNASNTTAIVTLNLNTHELNPTYGGTSPGAFNVGDQTGSVTVVYLASSAVAGKGLVVPGRIVVGRFGNGTLFVTNGNVSVANTFLASAGGCGTLVLSGPTVVWSNFSALAIGNNSNSFGSALVISNSAHMDVASSLRVGCGASGGSSNNTLLLDSGGKLTTHSGPVTIGHRSSGAAGSYNNTATVQGGAVWDNQNVSLVIGSADGGAATGNVLTVGASGFVTNVSQLMVTATNTLNLLGGLLDATMTCTGTVQGFGTVLGDATIADGGFLSPFNSQGALVFSNRLILASTATTTVQLGTNTNATVARGGLTLGGTLNITDAGGFGPGNYTLFTYSGTLTGSGLTIGTVPNTRLIYTIDTTSTPYQVKLNVMTAFQQWQLHYFNSTNLDICPQAAGNADPDGDGMSNTNEFLTGFNPTNSAAYLHVISIANTNTTDINVIYLGANGDSTWSPGVQSRTNILEYSTGNPADGSYSNNFLSAGQTNILSGGTGLGTVTNMMDSGGATNTPSRFYRVRVLVP